VSTPPPKENKFSALLLEGLDHYRKGRMLEAVRAWEEAYTLEPSNLRAREFLRSALERIHAHMAPPAAPQQAAHPWLPPPATRQQVPADLARKSASIDDLDVTLARTRAAGLPRTVRVGAALAALLLVAFAAYALYYVYVLHGEPLECGCFGRLIASQLGVATALRNLALLVPAALVFFGLPRLTRDS